MAKIIHMMVRVLDETRSLDFYAKAFGLEPADRLPFDGFTLIYLRNAENDVELELTVNHDRTEPYTHGDGYGHMAVAVEDLEREHARLSALDYPVTPVKEFAPGGRLLARFFFVTDPDGYRIEVLQRHGRYR